MSEASETTTTAEAPANAPAEGTDAAALAAVEADANAVAPVTEPVEEDVDLDSDPEEDVFADPAKARALAEKYRKEAAKNRVKAKEANAWKDGWTDSDAQVLSEVIQLAAKDPKVGAAKMREIAALLDGGDVEGAAAVAAEASEAAGAKADEAKALTEEDVAAKVKEALDQAEQKREIAQKRDAIVARTKELGYDGSAEATPEQRSDYFTLLHLAQHECGGDLDKAHALIEARNQAVIDAYVTGVRERAAGQPLHAKRGDDSVIEPPGDNKTWASARERTEARLVALREAKKA